MTDQVLAPEFGEVEVWDLMTRDLKLAAEELVSAGIETEVPPRSGAYAERQYQIFEVVTAIVFSKLRPDYRWSVSPRSKDGGIDFVGRSDFLKSIPLGIDASIIIGGQCKKRNRAGKLLDELAGSLIAMGRRLRPTFFIAVVSARLSEERVTSAKRDLEGELRRHCHIFDRRGIEALIADQIDAVAPILRAGLSKPQSDGVVRYFSRRGGSKFSLHVAPAARSMQAGAPFRLVVDIRHQGAGSAPLRLRWVPGPSGPAPTLVAPVGGDFPEGAPLSLGKDPIDPFADRLELEFLTYSVGVIPLGSVEVQGPGSISTRATLPDVEVMPNLRPRFYATPYRRQLEAITEALGHAEAGEPTVLAVLGNGGSGKTRLCQEAGLEGRRRGAEYITAEQVVSIERPYRIFAELLIALAGPSLSSEDPAADVLADLSRLQPPLAERARPLITALVGSTGKATIDDDQLLLSCFVLLAVARSQSKPLIIHLQNLHWCTGEALEFVERLIWQLQRAALGDGVNSQRRRIPILFLLEGRTHEQRHSMDRRWSTRAFEEFLDGLKCRRIRCPHLDDPESAAFVRRLFEEPWSADRQLPESFTEAQEELIVTLCRTSGGNPFHILEHLRLLKQSGLIGLSPVTGLAYLTQPVVGQIEFSTDVIETIRARWIYLASHAREAALLVAAAAMFEDRLPTRLFTSLWRRLAPALSRPEVLSLELFRFPEGETDSGDVGFRHENYFHALHELPLGEQDRRAILASYLDWFETNPGDDPDLIFLEARVRLQAHRGPDERAAALLRRAVEVGRNQAKPAVAARAITTLLDEFMWAPGRVEALDADGLVAVCDDELALCAYLITAGRRDVAGRRVDRALERLGGLPAIDQGDSASPLELQRMRLLAMSARIKFNDGQPIQAAAISGGLVRRLERLGASPDEAGAAARDLVMEVLQVHAVAAALAGDLELAREASGRATSLALAIVPATPHAVDVVSCHGNIMSAFDARAALDILLRCAAMPGADEADQPTLMRLKINTDLVRIVLAYEERDRAPGRSAELLAEAWESLSAVHRLASALGRFSTAAAAALLLGLAATLRGDESTRWFAEAVTGASRGRQLETLWRSQINLAHSLDCAGRSPLESAAAAMGLLEQSLDDIPDPDKSPRFRLVAVPLAAAARYCIVAGDPRGAAILERFPALRHLFVDVAGGVLRPDRGGFASHEWLRVGGRDYVLY
ncbi:MAG TPA: AAA family ATPase [Allosphingosinicella sp.]